MHNTASPVLSALLRVYLIASLAGSVLIGASTTNANCRFMPPQAPGDVGFGTIVCDSPPDNVRVTIVQHLLDDANSIERNLATRLANMDARITALRELAEDLVELQKVGGFR